MAAAKKKRVRRYGCGVTFTFRVELKNEKNLPFANDRVN